MQVLYCDVSHHTEQYTHLIESEKDLCVCVSERIMWNVSYTICSFIFRDYRLKWCCWIKIVKITPFFRLFMPLMIQIGWIKEHTIWSREQTVSQKEKTQPSVLFQLHENALYIICKALLYSVIISIVQRTHVDVNYTFFRWCLAIEFANGFMCKRIRDFIFSSYFSHCNKCNDQKWVVMNETSMSWKYEMTASIEP